MQYNVDVELWGLFLSAFISSTLAPGGSEIVLAFLVLNSDVPPYQLGLVATIGNSLGALTTLSLGYLARVAPRWLRGAHRGGGAGGNPQPGLEQSFNPRAVSLARKWGVVVLLFSWLPLIGDALCFAAGWLRLSITGATLCIIMGKAARYSALIYFLVQTE